MSAIIEENGFSIQPICNKCKHQKSAKSCAAFKVIPYSIIFRGGKHDKPLKEQGNNIVFTPIENG